MYKLEISIIVTYSGHSYTAQAVWAFSFGIFQITGKKKFLWHNFETTIFFVCFKIDFSVQEIKFPAKPAISSEWITRNINKETSRLKQVQTPSLIGKRFASI